MDPHGFSLWLSLDITASPGFPPQLCALALGSAGLARAWVLAGAAASLPQLWCLVSHGWGQGMGGGDQEITDITDVYKCVYI